MSLWFEVVRDLQSGAEAIRRRAYGVIEVAEVAELIAALQKRLPSAVFLVMTRAASLKLIRTTIDVRGVVIVPP